jgi:hypothetical protein
MGDDDACYRASDRALLTELGDGTGVLLDMDSKFYFTLNETAIYVWKQLSEQKMLTRKQLAERVSDEFDVDAAQAVADLEAVLTLLTRERLVQSSPGTP